MGGARSHPHPTHGPSLNGKGDRVRTNTSRANARRRCTRSGAWLRAYAANQAGVSALEYVVLAGIIVIAVAALSTTIKGIYTTAFTNISTKVNTATGG
jgi:pilus assembly protein Flp/PilA